MNRALGLIRYGNDRRDPDGFATRPTDISPRPLGPDATARARLWRFRNGGGSFGFRGRVLANVCADDCTPGVGVNEGSNAPLGTAVFPKPNGTVLAAAEGNGVAYLAGGFTRTGGVSGPIIFTEKDSSKVGVALAGYPSISGGTVDAAASDTAGGFYLGGTFTTVDGVARPRLIHINASGAVITTFVPPTGVVADGKVQTLAFDAGRNVLWVGRSLPTHLAALNGTTGASAANINLVQPNGAVLKILVSGTNVFIAGAFEQYVNNQTHKVAKLSAATGLFQDFKISQFQNNKPDVKAFAIATNGTTLYIGGDFSLAGRPTQPPSR